jgi:hypothetical protein
MDGWGGFALLLALTLLSSLVAAALTLTAALDADGIPRSPLGVPDSWSWELLQVVAPLACLLTLVLLVGTVTVGVLRANRR